MQLDVRREPDLEDLTIVTTCVSALHDRRVVSIDFNDFMPGCPAPYLTVCIVACGGFVAILVTLLMITVEKNGCVCDLVALDYTLCAAHRETGTIFCVNVVRNFPVFEGASIHSEAFAQKRELLASRFTHATIASASGGGQSHQHGISPTAPSSMAARSDGNRTQRLSGGSPLG